ncbi:MAG: molybdate ABC transporter substrate-binding protein [Planctomycetaceae bacterium]|nr:molybdate ABC transporter substrate-binding protein [Planctomycetaceae bacterium]
MSSFLNSHPGRRFDWRLLIVLAIAGLGGSCGSGGNSAVNQEPLIVYCAASNKTVLESIRQAYEAEFKTPVQVQFGASQTLLASLDVAKSGDLFLPADDSYLTMARERKLIAEHFPLASMHAVVVVPKGNPQQIRKLDDLLRPEVRLAQANPESAAIGKMTKEALQKIGRWDALHGRTTVYTTTVNEVANNVKVGAVDAGIVFDAVLTDYESLEAVKLDELQAVVAHVGVAVLKSSEQPTRALHFARYLSAEDKGLTHYRRLGFQTVEGDTWSEQPEVTIYSGSMLRPAIEATITAFEQREGVKVTRVYNGCGILVAQMKAGQVPDAYFACDIEFMKQVQSLFGDATDVSQNELVIMVKKGNPHKIASLKDLAKPNLRVGVGHEKQCALGWLTQRTFSEGGVQAEIMKNVVVQTPSGDMLVNQMRTGSLDAAVAYLSNAAGAAADLDAVRITGLPCSVATQPFAVAKESKQPQLVARLLEAIRTEESQSRFTNEGFRWLGAEPQP